LRARRRPPPNAHRGALRARGTLMVELLGILIALGSFAFAFAIVYLLDRV
jgi:hypothetical protein